MALLLIALLFTALIGIPVAFAIGGSSLVYFVLQDRPELVRVVPLRMLSGIDVFTLLAIPMFLFAAECMTGAGITERLVRLAQTLVGHVRGGLAYTNVLISLFFGGITGTALSDVSAMGPVLVPAMEKKGYTREFAAAVTAGSSLLGAVIPPSVVAVVYAGIVGGVSVGALFLAGIVPGLLITASHLGIVAFKGTRLRWPTAERRASLGEVAVGARDALTALMMPLIVVCGIVFGVFTATEAAAIAAGYAVLLGTVVYRSVGTRDLMAMLRRVAVTTSVLLIVASAASIVSWIFGYERVSEALAAGLLGITENRLVLLLLVVGVLLFVGMWLETLAAIIIFGPVFSSVMVSLGFHPVHFGMVMLLALVIGFITPPFGVCLFAASAVTRCPLRRIVGEIWPYIVADVAILILVALVPELALRIPRLAGLL
jgi:tripartite ATP-independent transporter DctM subunit